MIPHAVRQQLNAAHAVGDYRPLLALIPYAGLIGIECERQGDDVSVSYTHLTLPTILLV